MKRRHWLLVAVIALVVIGGGVAAAFWSAPGAGGGSAGTSLPASVTLGPGQPMDDVFPGDTSDVAVTVTNPNTYAVHIATLELDPTSGDGGYGIDLAHAGCPIAVLSYDTQANGGSGWMVPAASGGVDGEVSIDLTDALSMAVDAPGACQGADFVVHLVPTP